MSRQIAITALVGVGLQALPAAGQAQAEQGYGQQAPGYGQPPVHGAPQQGPPQQGPPQQGAGRGGAGAQSSAQGGAGPGYYWAPSAPPPGMAPAPAAPPVEEPAPRFGATGDIAVGAERLFGFASVSATATVDAGNGQTAEATESTSSFTLLGQGSPLPAFMLPRVGFDAFVTEGLSLGGFLLFGTRSSKRELGGSVQATRASDGPTETLVVLGPRIGYAAMFSDTVGLWPRGGITYVSDSAEDGVDRASVTMTELTLEALLIVVPVEHVGFTVGPIVEVGLGGETEISGTSGSQKMDTTAGAFGIQAGLLAYF